MLRSMFSAVKAAYHARNTGVLPPSFARQYLKYRVRQSIPLKSQEHTARVLHYDVHFFDHARFVFLLNEIFVHPVYAFSSPTERPFILDCGANIGMACLFFKATHPDAEILAFEPDPTTFALLEKNITGNALAGVTLVNKAVAREPGSIDFFFDANAPGDLRMSTVAGRFNRDVRSVEAVRLSGYIDRDVDMLKLDVEGAEYEVLLDLQESGALRRVRRAVIEYHHNVAAHPNRLVQILAMLEEAGFGYQLLATTEVPVSPDTYQDVVICAYRPGHEAGRS